MRQLLLRCWHPAEHVACPMTVYDDVVAYVEWCAENRLDPDKQENADRWEWKNKMKSISLSRVPGGGRDYS